MIAVDLHKFEISKVRWLGNAVVVTRILSRTQMYLGSRN